MRPLSDFIHRTPWWALVLGGVAVMVTLAVFVVPFHLIEYRKEGATPEENKAIKREVDNTFAEGALDLSRSAILAMRGTTNDPLRRVELDKALEELDRARTEIRDTGREALRARREAIDTAREAASEAASAIEEARRSAEEALKEAGLENDRVRQALEQSLKSAKEAEEEVNKALSRDSVAADERKKHIVIGMGRGKDRPALGIDVSKATPGEKRGAEIRIDIDDPAEVPAVVLPPLPPEVRAQIRENVSGDIRKIGIGAGLVLLFIPMFILAVVAKFFIDRSRASQRLADLKRKEAEYHLMSRQVTEAKLQALQAQVEPHFLYNTLANVQALTEVDPAQANTMVGHLIQYLRSALPKMRESISTVGQEVELVRAYLNILQMRMGKRLSFEISVPENLLATSFPPLMLPSLVENAIKHGLEPQREGGAVLITAQAQDGRLRLAVSDTGRGFGDTVGAGLGLANLRERLAALYGDAAKLTLESNSPDGVIATIEVPLDGLRAASGVAPGDAQAKVFVWPGYVGQPAQPAEPRTTTGKVLSAVGTAERTWRKTLSFAFVALVVVAAVVSGLGVFGVLTGIVPVHVGSESLGGTSGALIGAAGIAVAFAVVVIVLALVAALIYGLGWLFLGLAIFIPVVVLIATLPATAPIILLGLFVWWLVRRKKKVDPVAAPKVEPVMRSSPETPPPVPFESAKGEPPAG